MHTIQKVAIILLTTIFGATIANAQVTNTFPANGSVGIGTTSPGALLDVNGATQTGILLFKGVGGNSNTAHYDYGIYQEPVDWAFPFPKLVINYHTGIKMVGYYGYGGMKFYTGVGAQGVPTGLAFSIGDGDNHVRVAHSLLVSESIGIGTSNTGAYALAVEGTIGARKVRVTQAAWADYVFEPAYKFPSIAEVERYVKQHKHLPGIPSEKDVTENGIDVGEMNKMLLQKIEEQMLYIIELNKKVDSLTIQVKEITKK
ncbi:hypothetical protein GFS24_04895 [Chitinophaga sp. SYP-B3965]|uniref:hypothetical protein n=1 Tax=Chitinophaga sp. SYP-B3965 TaxID=2663120 RepID=UPI0012997865|nr:hypothetical protein [Chitinophaga sp. SYP-B3965]MRG44436.1 hypothetical protein [Chitinophaga sp. SYP-B3965]